LPNYSPRWRPFNHRLESTPTKLVEHKKRPTSDG
jgi:hypothetical protein